MTAAGSVRVVRVGDRRTVRAWVRLPRDVYRDDPVWVPPLWAGERAEARAAYGGAQVTRFVAMAGDRAVGRVSCSLIPGLDPVHLSWYEAVDDDRVAEALFTAAAEHARSHGRASLVGPRWHTLLDPPGGIQVDGFDAVLPAGTPHHPRYYRRHWEDVGGFSGVSTVFTFAVDRAGQVIPDWLRVVDARATQDGYHSPRLRRFRDLDRHSRELVEMLNAVALESDGLPGLTEAEVDTLRRRLRLIVRADLVRYVFHGDTLVGVLAAVPELGPGIRRARGRLLPHGWWWILRERRRGPALTVLSAAVHPDHQDRGAIAVAAHALFTDVLAAPRWQRVYAPMVEATNTRSRALAEHGLGARPVAEYRIYERAIT